MAEAGTVTEGDGGAEAAEGEAAAEEPQDDAA